MSQRRHPKVTLNTQEKPLTILSREINSVLPESQCAGIRSENRLSLSLSFPTSQLMRDKCPIELFQKREKKGGEEEIKEGVLGTIISSRNRGSVCPSDVNAFIFDPVTVFFC